MISVNLYTTFEKKTNSTKQPSGTAALEIEGNLIKPCSILHPVIQIKRLAADASPEAYVYAVIPAFNRYYFVRDWIWMDGLWELHMDCDVLASWKTDIGELSEYILRTNSNTTDYNPAITDTMYPATTDFTSMTYILTNIFATNITTGCYIVGIISGGSTSAVGAISYYAMTSAQFGALKDKLFSQDNLEIMHIITSGGQPLVTDLSQEVLKTLYNPYQYIVSCMWFPFGVSAITDKDLVATIPIGWWDYPLEGYRIYAQRLELGNETFQITAHPQASRGTYLNYAPYTRRTLIGRFGSVAIDTSLFNVGDIISIAYMIDLITGQCYAKISNRNESGLNISESLIAERNFLLGVPIQIAQVGTDYLGTAVSAINTVSQGIGGAIMGIATGKGAIMGAISGAATGIYNTLQTVMPQVETSGQNGSFLAPINSTHVIEQFFNIADEDIEHRGRPLCELRTIKNLSGFILCAEGDHDIPCMLEEKEAISNYLTTGFFWE